MEWIVTDDIRRETWRRILEFANLDLTKEKIAQQHGPAADASTRSDYSKQATQVRVCALQAKEYFDAAVASSLYTSPNHAYYGAVSLASMMMLIFGDGTKSLDYLRRDRQNRRHGLRLSTQCNATSSKVGLTLVESCFAEIESTGHFANWYSTLPPKGPVYGTVIKHSGTAMMRNYDTVGDFDVPKFDTLVGTKHSILDLLRYLPDLSDAFYRYRVTVPRSRTTLDVEVITNDLVRYRWIIHGAQTSADRDALLENFSVRPRFNTNTIACDLFDTPPGAAIRIDYQPRDYQPGRPHALDTIPMFKWPSSRDTLNHDTISYATVIDTYEISDLYLVAFQLSMIARYYPDLWVGCIDSQCKAAKLIEGAISLVIKKLPILALSMLTPGGLTISTHREPWKS